MGYVTDKYTLDVGCGGGFGTIILASKAKEVWGIDPEMAKVLSEGKVQYSICPQTNLTKVRFIGDDIFNVKVIDGNTSVAIEIFEHVPDPDKFIARLAEFSNELFITTPLAEVTGKTVNPEHVAEYSEADFRKILEKYFNIEKMVFQLSDLTIVDKASPNGCSYDPGHVVQMAWCKRKEK